MDQHQDMSEILQDADEPSSSVDTRHPPIKMRRPSKSLLLTIAVIAALLAALTIGTFYAVAAIRTNNQARAEVVEAYDVALATKTEAYSQLIKDISAAKNVLVSVTKDEVADSSTLDNLARQVEHATKTAEETNSEPQDLAGMSNEDVSQLTLRTTSDSRVLALVTDTLSQRVTEVQDSVAMKEKADEEARLAAEAEKKAAELAAAKQSAQPITYEDLFRAGDSLAGQYFTFEGKIIQDAGKSDNLTTFRVNITADQGYSRVFWQDTVLLYVAGETAQKLLEDDIIRFTAMSMGVTSYKSIMGATIELPALMAEGVDVTITGRDG